MHAVSSYEGKRRRAANLSDVRSSFVCIQRAFLHAGIGRREPVFMPPEPTAAEGRRRGLTAEGPLPDDAAAEPSAASEAGQALIHRNNALVECVATSVSPDGTHRQPP